MVRAFALAGIFALVLTCGPDPAPVHAQKASGPTSVGLYKTFYAIDVKNKSKAESWSHVAECSTRKEAEAALFRRLQSLTYADYHIVEIVRLVLNGQPKGPPEPPAQLLARDSPFKKIVQGR